MRTMIAAAGAAAPLALVLTLAAGACAQDPQAAPREATSTDGDVAAAKRLSRAFSKVAQGAIPAVVSIEVERRVTGPQGGPPGDLFERFFGPPGQPGFPEEGQGTPRTLRGQGSGFIVSSDGTILTNHHVVGEAERILVRLQDGRQLEAEVVGSDAPSDVAVIRLTEEAENLPVLPLGSSKELEVGEWVIAVGSPFGLGATVTAGVVSAKGRNRVGIVDYEDFIQTDAAINPGNSGGPLLNLDGEVVGINSAIVSRTGGYQGIGFAIPIDMAARIKDQLVAQGRVTRGYLGVVIQDLTPDLAESLGLDEARGAVVAQVTPGSPAAEAGFEVGDVVVGLDGSQVRGVGDLRNAVSMKQPGSEVRVRVLRAGQERTLEVEVGQLPDQATAAGPGGGGPDADFGFTVQELTPDVARRLGYEGVEGVLVGQVAPGSPAAEAGLRPGHLILRVGRQAVTSVEDFWRAMRAAEDDGRALLLVSDGQSQRFVVLQLAG